MSRRWDKGGLLDERASLVDTIGVYSRLPSGYNRDLQPGKDCRRGAPAAVAAEIANEKGAGKS